jgi:hypothetical protein
MTNSIRSSPYWSLSMLVSLIVMVEILTFNAVSNLQPVGSGLSVSTFYAYCLVHIVLLGISAIWFGQLTKDYCLARYADYIKLHQDKIHRRHENAVIPRNLDYKLVPGLPDKTCQKLMETQPTTLGQASAISGVTPAAISDLLLYLKSGMLQIKAIGRNFGIGIVVTGASSTVFYLVIPLVSDLEWKAEWHLFFSDVFSRLLLSV